MKPIRMMGVVGVAALALSACASGTIDVSELGLITEGTLTVGSDIPYAPFEFNEDGGELTGFDVELIEAAAGALGLEVEWVNAGFDTIFTALDGGQFDIVASAVTAYAEEGTPAFDTVQERRGLVGFTVPYYSSLQSLTVNTEETPEIEDTAGLPDGAKVGVQRGTTGQSWAEANLGDRVEITTFPKAPQMFQALESGALAGIVNDLPVSLEAIAERPSLAVVEQIDTGEEYGFAVHQDNPALRDALDGALKDLFADGTYATIFKKYFPDQELPAYAKEA